MATYSKFDLSSGSPDRPLYTSAQRGSFVPGTMERSGSFRESTENPALCSLPNMLRSSSTVTQGDVMNFLQCLSFDPKLQAFEHKSSRQGELKRHISVALGISPDNSPSVSSKGKLIPSPEELKRIMAGLRECSNKARERLRIFNEALSVVNKFFPTKKRSRSDVFPSERSGALLSGDRSVLGPSLGKMGSQSHAIANSFELEKQKSEERTKNAVPNKRTRTSLVDMKLDVRSNTVVRQSGAADREREMVRLANSGAVHGEDRTLPIGVDGWGEKPKMKKKRSGIKVDISSGISTKPIDGCREPKQGMQQRSVTDTRSRLNNDSHGFRPGVANGAAIGKVDGISQQTGLGMRSSIPRPDQDNNPLLNDRRDRSFVTEKDRANPRAVNKSNVREDFNSASPTSNQKMNASVRAPRSGSGVSTKLSPVVHRAAVASDWELSHCTTKSVASVGVGNRKRAASPRSSSPPVAQWSGQRPQKISRTARRTNLVPIVSNNDEILASDNISDAGGSETGLGVTRRLPGNSPQRIKLKGEPLSSAAFSESEESGAAEIKSKDKRKRSDEIDEKPGHNVQKVSSVMLPSRKNKLVTGEDVGDGVRRQGRTGRGFTSTRAVMPTTVEKRGNVGTAKQLRSTRLGFDKTESKPGRPPTRKISGRKAYTRQRHTAINGAADFLVGSDDGHQELLAAANAVINPTHAFTGSFWRQLEPFFRLISDLDSSYLKKQLSLGSAALAPTLVSLDGDGNIMPDGFGVTENEKGNGIASETRTFELHSQLERKDQNVIPLCQRLLAALIPEEENVEIFSSGNEFPEFDASGFGFELDGELESESVNHQSGFQFSGHTTSNGYRITGKTEHDELESDISGFLNTGLNSHFGHSVNGLLPHQASVPSMACSDYQYENMSLNEKLVLELQSIGIFLEPKPDIAPTEDEISVELNRLKETHQGQLSKKKGLVGRVLKSALEMKESQEKEFEQNALDKLIGMTYEKYNACRGPSGSSGKSSSNKMAKQAALAFAKRTLERCHQFEETGKSCFSEPIFREMFLCGSSHFNGLQSTYNILEGESAKQYGNGSTLSFDARVSASTGSPSLTSRLGHNMDNHDIDSSDVLLPLNLPHEQTIGKEDAWSARVKKRELLLDDVIGTPPGIGSSLSSSTKGKRSERDREGKGHSREVLSRNGSTKIGRSAVSNVKGERKYKAKPKQKTTQLSVSVNGLMGKISEQPKPSLHPVAKSSETVTHSNAKEKDEFALGILDDEHEPLDLSHLQLPGIDVLGGPDDIGGQGQDLDTWLNIDDDGLQDNDFMGLEIPMDDLADLNMMV